MQNRAEYMQSGSVGSQAGQSGGATVRVHKQNAYERAEILIGLIPQLLN